MKTQSINQSIGRSIHLLINQTINSRMIANSSKEKGYTHFLLIRNVFSFPVILIFIAYVTGFGVSYNMVRNKDLFSANGSLYYLYLFQHQLDLQVSNK